MTSDNYSMHSFGEGLNFSDGWLNDLPPTFMGSTTSFGQQPGPSMMPPAAHGIHHPPNDYNNVMPLSSHSMPPPPPPPPQMNQPLQANHSHQSHLEHRHTPDDVLTAAAFLHNGATHRHNSVSSEPSYPRRAIGPPVGHLRHQGIEEFREEGRRSVSVDDHDNTFTEWMFGSQDRRQARNPPPADMQWGSDSNFNQVQGFTPSSDRETMESLSNEQLKYLDCFKQSKSAASTRPSSPTHASMHPPANPRASGDVARRQQEVEAPPRKRRKSKNIKDVNISELEPETPTTKTARRKKTKAEQANSNSAPSPPVESGAAGKRRKSGVNSAKASRENLTEEQKRENHIKSEQKRRTLIKEGFDDLCELVPGLRGGGFSKSTMLAMAGEWLDEIIKGNEILTRQLATMEGR